MFIRRGSPHCDASLRQASSTAIACESVAFTNECTTSECVICASLADIDGRYFGRLLHDSRARGSLAHSIMTSMGFCAQHAASIARLGDREASALHASILDANQRLGALFARTTLQDDLVQDILFSARGRCPACAYFHRSEGRALARVLQDPERIEQVRRNALPTLCFVHAQRLLQRAEPPLRPRMTRLLRTKAKTMWSAFDAAASGGAAERADRLCRLIYPLAAEATTESPRMAACPVCEAIAQAQRRWLATAADNVRLAQPGWIALPTCHRHLLQCLAQHDTALQHAALARYIEAALPGHSAPVQPGATDARKRRRRNSRRWFDTKAGAANVAMVDAEGGHRPRESCPGCDAEEMAARRAIAALIRKASTAKETIGAVVAGVCLKHCAEMLIYAPDPHTAHRLCRALCAVLLDGGMPRAAGAG